MVFGLTAPETYEWSCPGSIDNFCSEPRAMYLDVLLPPKINVVAYTLTGVVFGGVLGLLVVLRIRTINRHRRVVPVVGLGTLLGTLLFLVTRRS